MKVKRYITLFLTINRKVSMARLRLNQEYRNKISNRMRVHLGTRGHARERKVFCVA